MRHILTATVMNEPGVLAHVANMFSARGFNIDSLVVGRTEDPNFSRMTIVVTADERTLDQVRKQLAKIVTVVKVRDYKETPYVSRDLMLIKLSAASSSRSEIIELAALFRGRVVDVGMSSLMVELSCVVRQRTGSCCTSRLSQPKQLAKSPGPCSIPGNFLKVPIGCYPGGVASSSCCVGWRLPDKGWRTAALAVAGRWSVRTSSSAAALVAAPRDMAITPVRANSRIP